MGIVNIVKLCVGAESVEDLALWQEENKARWPEGRAAHVTRMWPRRESEVLGGGSLYWVIKGVIQCRQRILGLEEVRGEDGIARCAILLDRRIHRTEAAARRPFQGWRYLDPAQSPRDLAPERERDDPLPPALAQALAEIGLR
ncbi:DUF1489 family protein [Pseudogemmobacter sonorensis]|uniref:DUF1489 family protein n=1 Tax=Pseudogemmobacter sonorensis TaxID=2989681 RepID=UPI003678445C